MIHNHEVPSSILGPATLKIHGNSSTCREDAGAFFVYNCLKNPHQQTRIKDFEYFCRDFIKNHEDDEPYH